jgi:hypothetical protein
VHPAAAWLTVTDWPATTRLPLRAVTAALASTLTLIDPLPLPLAGDTLAQEMPDDAVQLQPAGAETVSAEVPPVSVTETDVGDTE